jgi:SAM-dependent methyltransferase
MKALLNSMVRLARRLLRLGRGARPSKRPRSQRNAAVDGMPVTEEAVVWALRLLVGREPAYPAEVALHQANRSLGELRTVFMGTPEFAALVREANGQQPRFAIPPFLLRPPSNPAIPWRPGQPTLHDPVSQLCTAVQFDDPEFDRILQQMRLVPSQHRKLWEHVYIVKILHQEGLLTPGRRAIVFGCGRERIPAYLAHHGVEVLATDAPAEKTASQGWASTGQYAAQAADLFIPDLIEREQFERLVSFRPVDMNDIPADLAGRFDACWSTCSLEHLGSLQHGLDFIENSLSVLRPGGIAVHTTEFNLVSNNKTLDAPGLCVYRRRDMEALAARLIAKGHQVLPLNFHPGEEELDEVIDVPPYALPHLKLELQDMTCTSIGFAVRRAG